VSIRALFPTYVYSAALQKQRVAAFNLELLQECLQLRADDASGRRWSRRNYPGGYTSYGSAHRLHTMSPTFAALQRKLQRHLDVFARTVGWDLAGRPLGMTDCWVNIMPAATVHGLHLHPLSTVSGTYYVQVPRGAPGLKFEDPRLDRFMAAPPRSKRNGRDAATWSTFSAAPGRVILFESWLRHEVAPNPVASERISISFNYNWF
jgi:uncharacterized protein (TIGR02466 family)